MVTTTKDIVCPLKLLFKLKNLDPKSGCDSSPIFCGFNGRLVAKNPQKTTPFDVPIKYTQYVRYLSLWFGEVLGVSTQEFKAQYGSHSGRIVAPQRRPMLELLSNFGVNKEIGLP